jgi:hypothetical protein
MAEKKTRTKKTKQVGNKRCAIKGCRKARVAGTETCRVHQGEDPLDGALQLSEVDLLRFLKSDGELQNHSLEIKNLQQEQRLDNHEFDNRKRDRQARVNELVASINSRTAEQKQMLADMGKKYGFNPAIVSIDDKTGLIHEHRPGPAK